MDMIGRRKLDSRETEEYLSDRSSRMKAIKFHTSNFHNPGFYDFFQPPITFPRDCVNIHRCRPFTSYQKVVKKCFMINHISNSAHVFPPFGGQGIACGIQDGDALAWRLAKVLRLRDNCILLRDSILQAWALERRQGVDFSTKLTMINGTLCDGSEETLSIHLLRNTAALLSLVPGMPSYPVFQPLVRKKVIMRRKIAFPSLNMVQVPRSRRFTSSRTKGRRYCPIVS